MSDRKALEARASELNIAFRSNWKDETLREKIAEAEAEKSAAGEQTPVQDAAPAAVTDNETGAALGTAAPVAEGGGPGQAPALEPPAPDSALKVQGPKRGRWRAGMHFTPEPVILLISDLTAAQKAQIEADPTLLVTPWPGE
ncbi:hypothetical protein [Sagittula salina]|uniref:Mu-like prophage FluMu N-terminal domain-containing protein n=1 Tax=Sagittula salina TaxID=2820268 RepID=A0A940MQG3_9RHOB|nr:hypothetical protein [Sagittula salina]MBP0483945.1 hypothetical protein [Sagittula salina]